MSVQSVRSGLKDTAAAALGAGLCCVQAQRSETVVSQGGVNRLWYGWSVVCRLSVWVGCCLLSCGPHSISQAAVCVRIGDYDLAAAARVVVIASPSPLEVSCHSMSLHVVLSTRVVAFYDSACCHSSLHNCSDV